MNTRKNNTLLRTIAVITGIGLFLLGGVGVTGAAARAAIPGDALYRVKTTFEQAQLSLAQDAGDRAQMKMAFAAQRLEEIDALVREGRYREIRQAVVAFETDINSALLELETVSKADPVRASAIAGEVASALSRYAKILSDLAAVAPDAVRDEFNRALDTTQVAGGLNRPNVNANDNSSDDNSNANVNANDDNGNDDNGNDDRNANMNSNDDNGNDDRNANVNSNDDNGNDDRNANMNANDDNGNDDRNANVNDDNSNANMNANDDKGGDNSGGSTSGSGSSTSGSGSSTSGGTDDSSGKGGTSGSGGSTSGSGKDDKGPDDKSNH